MNEGMLGLIYFGVRAGTVAIGVLGCDIALVASIWRSEPWFLVAVAWIHSVSVVLTDVGMLGMKLVWVRDGVTEIVDDTFHANTCSLYTTWFFGILRIPFYVLRKLYVDMVIHWCDWGEKLYRIRTYYTS